MRHTAVKKRDRQTDGQKSSNYSIDVVCGYWVKMGVIGCGGGGLSGGGGLNFRHFFEKGDPETCLQKMEFFYLENKKSAKNTLTIR